jgi:hypothetical protein
VEADLIAPLVGKVGSGLEKSISRALAATPVQIKSVTMMKVIAHTCVDATFSDITFNATNDDSR